MDAANMVDQVSSHAHLVGYTHGTDIWLTLIMWIGGGLELCVLLALWIVPFYAVYKFYKLASRYVDKKV